MDRPRLPGFALACGLLWLLAGALYKLFDGSPNDLPQPVVEHSPFDKFDTFRLAIAAELAVVGLVLTVPRLGWVALGGIFSVFLTVLIPLALGGESSCGCFGSNVTIAPWQMMLIDGSLLGLLLFSAPWRLPREAGLGAPAFLPFLIVAFAAPLMKLDPPTLPKLVRPTTLTAGAGEGGATASPVTPTPDAGTSSVEGGTDADAVPTAEPEATEVAAALQGEEEAAAPDELPEFYELRSAEWTGQDFYAIDIAAFADQSMGAVLPNSHVVVYRQTCEVCKAHLEDLWAEAQNNPSRWADGGGSASRQSLVLLRIIENNDTADNNLCELLPEPSQKVTLPALKRGYGITTPIAFDVDENFMVQNVTDLGH
ncbi:MAG: hypothetical protein P8M11_06050 [Planctomycetota bacterium]|nr:hypothetical protein [Planctomycetota bacterium]MDG1984107.1 hypothetical protein [Planctomycetota bacterium]